MKLIFRILSLCFLLTTVTQSSYSQISFEKGYFINQSGVKTECLIRNMDWKNNPTQFKFAFVENAEEYTGSIDSITEFAVYNSLKYIRKKVKVDTSAETINSLSNVKDPLFVERVVFLKVLVEGRANLYLYETNKVTRFFYNLSQSEIEPLVYKRYMVSETAEGKNLEYRQQLWKDLKCFGIQVEDIEKTDYSKKNLVTLFVKYNKCAESAFINYEKLNKRDLFNLSIRPRYNSSSIFARNTLPGGYKVDFDTKQSFTLGLEAEFVLPYNKNKWAIVLEPTYLHYKDSKIIYADVLPGEAVVTNVEYNTVEMPLSLRHYMFLGNNAKLFLTASYVFEFSFNSSLVFKKQSNNTELANLLVNSKNNLALGAGVKLFDKVSAEARFYSNRKFLENHAYWYSIYQNISLIVGYSIF